MGGSRAATSLSPASPLLSHRRRPSVTTYPKTVIFPTKHDEIGLIPSNSPPYLLPEAYNRTREVFKSSRPLAQRCNLQKDIIQCDLLDFEKYTESVQDLEIKLSAPESLNSIDNTVSGIPNISLIETVSPKLSNEKLRLRNIASNFPIKSKKDRCFHSPDNRVSHFDDQCSSPDEQSTSEKQFQVTTAFKFTNSNSLLLSGNQEKQRNQNKPIDQYKLPRKDVLTNQNKLRNQNNPTSNMGIRISQPVVQTKTVAPAACSPPQREPRWSSDSSSESNEDKTTADKPSRSWNLRRQVS